MTQVKLIFQAIFLGILQGLTEFLPVSSSGHLVIAQYFCPQISQSPLILDITLHLGTLLALCLYFRKDLKNMLLNPHTAIPIMVATLVTTAVALPLKPFIEAAFHSPRLACLMLLFTGTFLFFAAKIRNNNRTQVGWREAVSIGLAQALAVLPGISRSGTTISTGVYLGLTGEMAGRFSFLIAIPAIFGAGLLELKDISTLPSGLFIPYTIGFLSSFLTGLWAIRWLLKILTHTQNKLIYFAYYCWLIGLIFFWLV